MFNSLKEFCDVVRLYYFRPYAMNPPEVVNSLRQIIRARSSSAPNQGHFRPSPPAPIELEDFALDASYQNVLDHIWSENLTAIPFLNRLEHRVGVVTCESGSLGARVLNSPCNRFTCIAIDSGLIRFLSKYLKFRYSLADTRAIIHYSRSNLEVVTSDTIRADFTEFLEHVRSTWSATGPILLLNEEATTAVMTPLVWMENFTLFHELSHVILGDLDNVMNGADGLSDIAGLFFPYLDNLNHRKEHAADLVALFLLFLKESPKWDDTFELRLALMRVVNDYFAAIGIFAFRPTEEHPNFRSRILCLVEHLLGPQFTPVFSTFVGKPFPEEANRPLRALRNKTSGVEDTLLPLILLRLAELPITRSD